MSNPPCVHCSSCTLGVGRSGSVKFASVRTRRKGGGACELTSAELPLIRPFASLAGASRVRGSACISDETRVHLAGRAPSVCERSIDRSITAIEYRALPARSTSEFRRERSADREIAGELFGAPVDRRYVSFRGFIPVGSVELSAFSRFEGWLDHFAWSVP